MHCYIIISTNKKKSIVFKKAILKKLHKVHINTQTILKLVIVKIYIRYFDKLIFNTVDTSMEKFVYNRSS